MLYSLYDKEDGILARLTELEKLQEAVDAFIKENDNYEKYADILNQIEASRQALTALSLPAGSTNLTEAIEAIIKAQLKEEDSSLANLKKNFKMRSMLLRRWCKAYHLFLRHLIE